MRFKAFCFAVPLVAAAFSLPAQAASEEECSIWICAPAGFPGAAGCAAALAAMIDRIKDLDPPLPPFSSCSQDNSDQGNSYQHGRAAFIPAHRECVRYNQNTKADICSRYKDVPSTHLHGQTCRQDREGNREPKGCTRTDHYVQVFINNQPPSDTFYFNIR